MEILNYQPHRPRRFGRRTRIGFRIAILLGLIAAPVHFGPQLWRRAKIEYWEYKCENYQEPPGTLVWGKIQDEQGHVTKSAVLPHTVGWWDNLDLAIRPGATPLLPYEKFVFGNIFSGDFSIPYVKDTIFLHARRSPAGRRRLVSVQMVYPYTLVTVIEPGRWISGPRIVFGPTDPAKDQKMRDLLEYGEIFRDGPIVYAGQPDPNDASHFSIDFSVHNQPGVIDGYLKDDESVELTVRDYDGIEKRLGLNAR